MDFSLLLEKLKDEGLDIAEDSARLIVKAVLEFVEVEVVKSENKYDDMLLAVMPILKAQLFVLIDKIDGEVDEVE